MKKLSTLIFSFLTVFLLTTCYAGDILTASQNEDQGVLAPSKWTQLSAEYFNPLNSLTLQDTLTKEQKLAQLPGYKLPKKALLFSALIPGAGELYSKSYIKAGVFFLAEVAAWTLYGSYTNKGKDQEKKYQQFANLHWNPDVWLQWIQNHEKLDDAHAGTMENYLSGDKSATTRQQYYEMIGKYPAFYVGWDFVRYYDNQSYWDNKPIQEIEEIHKNDQGISDYMDMRDKSNRLFRTARTATNYVIVNHILSAIDAAWSAKRHNNKLLEASIQFEQIFYVDQFQPVLSLKIKW